MGSEYHGEERRVGERREGFCVLHQTKCDQINHHTEIIEELQRSKMSIKMFRIIIAILLTVGGGYWYKMEKYIADRMHDSIKYQGIVSSQLKSHDVILKNMSRDVRETKLNLMAIMKNSEIEYLEIPKYYGD